MTEEQIEYIADLLKEVKIADIISTVTVGILFVLLILGSIYFAIKYQKVKKLLEEYYATLNEEDKKKLKMYKEIKKL